MAVDWGGLGLQGIASESLRESMVFASGKRGNEVRTYVVSHVLSTMSPIFTLVSLQKAISLCSSEAVLNPEDASLSSWQLIEASIVGRIWFSTFMNELSRQLELIKKLLQCLIPTSGCNGGL